MKYSAFLPAVLIVIILLSGCVSSVQTPTISSNTASSRTTVSSTSQTTATPGLNEGDGLFLLAGIYPGERIENIAERYGLHYVTQEEGDEAGLDDDFLYANAYHYRTFYDGKGLVVNAFADGTIGQVIVFAPGYDTPDGHQAGDEWPYNESSYNYAQTEQYGDISYDIYAFQLNGKIRKIVMNVFLDRILSETKADLNHNGIEERFVLSGRASTITFEVPSGMKVDTDITGADYLPDNDPATRPRLTVYEDEDIIWTAELNYYHTQMPEPFPTLTPATDGSDNCFIELCYPTGGSGGDMYYKVIYDDSKATYTTAFWFFGFDWDRPE